MSSSGGERLRLTAGWAVLLVWLLVAAAMLFAYRNAIASQMSIDPDDALRLVQVRDLLGGQGWWDISQHRINPAGGGGLMHWSRIVDAPLAAGIAVLTPLVGTGMAERTVTALWPLLLLGACFYLLMRAGRALGDARLAWAAPALLATDYVILYQFGPLRIDHHGWQGMLALAMLVSAIGTNGRRAGVLAGLAGAALVAISIEGLPVAALFGGLFAIAWFWTGAAESRLRLYAYLSTLTLAALVLQLLARGPWAVVQLWCDALSFPWLMALGVAALAVIAGGELVARWSDSRVTRGAVLVVAGLAAVAVLATVSPQCFKGPFADLDPLVVRYWYVNVREGAPLWRPFDAVSAYALAPLLVGLAGYALGWRRADDSALRRRWLVAGAATAGMTLLALLVLRVAATAHLLALPGCAMAGLLLWQRAQAMTNALIRIPLALLAMLALPPVAGALLAGLSAPLHAGGARSASDAGSGADARDCLDPASLAALDRMPPTLILAPLDLGPHLLQRTRHSVVATSHHRNNRAMAQVIGTFVGPMDMAEQQARATGADIVLICRDAREFRQFRAAPADTLADRLDRGDAPDWLQPVALGEGARVTAWRIVDSPPPRP